MVENNGIKLHLGCGKVIIPGFINADITPGEGVDLIVDVNNLKALQVHPWYGKVDFLYLSHVLEHFPTAQTPSLLKEFFDLIGEGGRVRIAVPDLDRICALYMEHFDWFKPPHGPWLGLIYGGQTDMYDFHKTGFNFSYLEWLLHDAGFNSVVRVDRSDDLGVLDASHSNLPFGNISLNVEAMKGSRGNVPQRFRYTPLEQVLSVLADVLTKGLSVLVRLRIALIRRRIGSTRS